MTPLSTDFTFLKNISSMTPRQMALSLTRADVSLFNRLAVQDFLEPDSTRRRLVLRLHKQTVRCTLRWSRVRLGQMFYVGAKRIDNRLLVCLEC